MPRVAVEASRTPRKSTHTWENWWPKSGPNWKQAWPWNVPQVWDFVYSGQAVAGMGWVGEPMARNSRSIASM